MNTNGQKKKARWDKTWSTIRAAQSLGHGANYRVSNIFAHLLHNDVLFFTSKCGEHINRQFRDITLDDANKLFVYVAAEVGEQFSGKSRGEIARIKENNLKSQD